MNRRQLIKNSALAGLGVLGSPMINLGRCRLAAAPAVEVSTDAIDVVSESTVVDMLGLLTLDWTKLFHWQRVPGAFAEPEYRKMESTGINVFHPAVESSSSNPYDSIRRWLAGWNRLLDSSPCYLSRISGVTDLELASKTGQIGVILGFQNSDHFRTTTDVKTFYRWGQRVSQLTYNEQNRLGSGCYVSRDRGLTALGGEVVTAMNRIGMAVDVSHCGERTSLDAIVASSKPVLVTHSNCKALVPGHPRCKSDEVIRRMAAAGGVIGITIVRGFVARRARPTLDDFLDHFDHVARLVGVEYVGLGSDVDLDALDPATGGPRPYYSLRGLHVASRSFQLADGLLRRGYRASDVELVLGGNFRRALGAIWYPPLGRVPERLTRRDPFCPAPRPAGRVEA